MDYNYPSDSNEDRRNCSVNCDKLHVVWFLCQARMTIFHQTSTAVRRHEVDFPRKSTEISTARFSEQEDFHEEGSSVQSTIPVDRRSGSPAKGDEIITYKRRKRVGGQKRKDPEDTELESLDSDGDGEACTASARDPSMSNSGKIFGVPAKAGKGFGRAETPSTLNACKRVIGPQKMPPPKRVIGQYFLDLGQSDFSHSTCPTCKLFYARGHENDEKVHKAFHRNFTQGIIFKGWQSERVASKLDDKGNRVIVVLAEDTHHQSKVREVIDVMELDLGLTPGWLLQRSCKVYLFISSSKKIVGCLMAEPIKFAFRVVPAQGQSPVKDGEPIQCEAEGQKPSVRRTEPQIAPDEGSSQRGTVDPSEPPATLNDEIDKSEQGRSEGESHPSKSSPEDAYSSDSLPAVSVSVASGNSPLAVMKVKDVLQHTVKPEPDPLRDKMKQDSAPVRDRMRTRKITDFFGLKTRQRGRLAGCKSESEVVDSKPDVKPLHSCKSELEVLDTKPDIKCLPSCKSELEVVDTKPDVKCVQLKAEADQESQLNGGPAKQADFRPLVKEERNSLSHVSEAAEDEKKPSASMTTKMSVQDGDSPEIRKDRKNVMIFGNVKFSREAAPRKRSNKERTPDLGSAILCTKTPVPAVCGVCVVWVSQTERRKGIATHLLDAMRKTFCLGVVLEPSQFAFSQPTPEGRRFAAHYCKTDEFLVYTTS